ncbi:hypothetical protein DWQ65_01165 [Treponema phagedenis]|uniref:hypothetical protein n=1 Tax=Treponema phagedenis TaxID=162 RepID=UPI0001F63DCD|nr:hypothetical protein [Treponema phagedenis]EFW38390.1 hypothetical protein HMPREF9554_01106 [Treponema phagedenis F0421]QSH98701.1 hypothetical protein DWQ65_01165 [Treponema phagedenis]TYT78509.1 hypothetical protein FS559_04925 [Treponema phagedenis]
MKKTFSILISFLAISFLSAQSLEDELFSDDEMVLSKEETSSTHEDGNLKLKTELSNLSLSLEKEKIRFGGSLDSKLDLGFTWNDPYSKKTDYKKSFLDNTRYLKTILNANLFFDARPKDNLKIYGKFIFSFPFEKELSGKGLVAVNPALTFPVMVKTSGIPYFKVMELYTDFSAKDIAFFRFGKHAVKWGTGYFYSPADIINISRIDPQNPTAEKEGPVSFRTHIIIPKTQYNFWFYLLPDTKEFKPEHTAAAAKAEFLFGNWEWGIGGYYRYEKAPRIMTTLSGSIAGKVSVFAEGIFLWGSDYTYHKDDDALTPYTEKNKAFFQATFGGSYTNTKSYTSLALQYFYNGIGYKNANDISAAIEKRFAQKNGAANSPEVLKAAQSLSEMSGNIGQHYIAFSLAQNKIGTEKVSAFLFQQFGISELSGLTSINLNWRIYEFISMRTGLSFMYPLSSKSFNKGNISYTLGFNLGGGKF